MGRAVRFSSLSFRQTAPGVERASISGPDAKHMVAELLRLRPGATLTETVPAGSDAYLYTLSAALRIDSGGASQAFDQDAFAVVEEGGTFTLANQGSNAAELAYVVAPPAGAGHALSGYQGPVRIISRRAAPAKDIPDQKKRRLFFVDPLAARSERAHAMIVEYQADTVTSLHQHPNADSMFVPLTGKVRFSFDGTDQIVERGGATVFPAGNVHGLCVAEGNVSFLEFHIPAGYTTLR